jgi:NADH-quinone oxidoreductase subunit L
METLAVFIPLASAILAGCLGRILGDRPTEIISCTLMLIAAGMSVVLFKTVALDGSIITIHLMNWIKSGDLNVAWSLRIDQLSAVMIFVVNVVSAMVHVYSVGYMSHDKSRTRFMSYLGLFTFAMLMLVSADNFVQMFFGWEGVGLASYLLIGFWHHKHSANAASMKAFIVNRVGDFGLSLGIFAVFMLFGTLNFNEVFAAVPDVAGQNMEFFGMQLDALTITCFLLFIGAMGKSAQLGLHTWLPDAMEGPTPVSALIHAATMVTAGVFLVARLSPMFEYAPAVMQFITIIGALTALIAATIAITQFDIKRVIAYSTMSQLGYMFFALGVSAYGAAMFHLFTHAFFKALLFLGAGSVIHAMSDEQDMRKMGGIWRLIPTTYVLMWIGNLALAGLPFFAGYYSKDMILETVFADHTGWGTFAFWCGIAAALLTAFYSWRLLILSFHGKPRADEKVMAHVHESGPVMIIPLVVLAIGAVFSGWLAYPYFVGDMREAFWGDTLFVLADNDTIEAAHHVPGWVPILPVIVALSGIALAWFAYVAKPGFPAAAAWWLRPLHTLLCRKWYFDEIYNALIVTPLKKLGRLFWIRGDGQVIDGIGPNGIAASIRDAAFRLRQLQTGFIYDYAYVILAGLVVFLSLFILSL